MRVLRFGDLFHLSRSPVCVCVRFGISGDRRCLFCTKPYSRWVRVSVSSAVFLTEDVSCCRGVLYIAGCLDFLLDLLSFTPGLSGTLLEVFAFWCCCGPVCCDCCRLAASIVV